MLDMLSKVYTLGCRAVNAPMKANAKLLPDQGKILDDPDGYCRLVGKLTT